MITMRTSGRLGDGPVDLDRDAPAEQLDRNDEERLVVLPLQNDSLDACERPAADADPLALLEERDGRGFELRLDDAADGFDLRVGNHGQAIPALSENSHQPASLDDLDVACLVHRLM